MRWDENCFLYPSYRLFWKMQTKTVSPLVIEVPDRALMTNNLFSHLAVRACYVLPLNGLFLFFLLVNMYTCSSLQLKWWRMKTSVNQTAALCGRVQACICLCPHMWQNELLLCLRGNPQSTVAVHRAGGTTAGPQSTPQDNVRGTRVRTQSTALFRSHLFFHLFGGVAALSTTLLTRSGCGVGLIQLALCVCVCVCVWNRLRLLKIVARETILNPASCVRGSGEERKLPK